MSTNPDSHTLYLHTLDDIRLSERMISLFREDTTIHPGPDEPIYIIGAGKASTDMALALESILGPRISGGLVIDTSSRPIKPKKITVLQGMHPLPNQSGLDATNVLLEFCAGIPKGATVYFLASGGMSALLVNPLEPITLPDLRTLYALLIKCGASIHEINTVRKSVSSVKGGRLLARLRHVRLIDLIVSDIPDNDLSMVGSGPTVAQTFSPAQAIEICQRREIWEQLPDSVREVLLREAERGDVTTAEIQQHLMVQLLSAQVMAQAAAMQAHSMGYQVWLRRSPFSGPMELLEREILEILAWMIPGLAGLESRSSDPFANFESFLGVMGMHTDPGEPVGGNKGSDPGGTSGENHGEDHGEDHAKHMGDRGYAFIFYGECTLTVTGDGVGGRNQELALRIGHRLFAKSAENQEQAEFLSRIEFMSAGTDGIDGPTDAAGAVVSQARFQHSDSMGLDADVYLSRNDSFGFFDRVGGQIKPGPTGNNVMDLQVLLVRSPFPHS